jgi:hypothetical protein
MISTFVRRAAAAAFFGSAIVSAIDVDLGDPGMPISSSNIESLLIYNSSFD